MKINWKRFFGLFLLFNMFLMCSGCAAAWIGAISALLPAISAAVSAILAFVMSLQGKTVPPATVATIQKIESIIQVELDNVKKLVGAVASGGVSILVQIKAALQSVLDNLSSILSGLPITDSSTLQKITELVALAVAAVQAILTILPIAVHRLAEKPSQAHLAVFDQVTSDELKNAHIAMQASYARILREITDNADVNKALADLQPRELP